MAGRGLVGFGPGSSGPICPGSRHEPGPMGLAPGPQPLVTVRGWNRDRRGPLVPVPATNRNQLIAYIYPSPASRALPLLCFSWPARGELCGALAHLLCTRGVRWNARATLLKLSPLQARPPSSIFLNICLDLAVRHAPSPSSPSSSTRVDLITDTTVVSLLFLSCF